MFMFSLSIVSRESNFLSFPLFFNLNRKIAREEDESKILKELFPARGRKNSCHCLSSIIDHCPRRGRRLAKITIPKREETHRQVFVLSFTLANFLEGMRRGEERIRT